MACLSLLVVHVSPAFKKNFLELSDDGEEFSNYALLLQGVFTGLGAEERAEAETRKHEDLIICVEAYEIIGETKEGRLRMLSGSRKVSSRTSGGPGWRTVTI